MDDDGSLRLFSLDPPAEPPVELLITDTTGWDEVEPRLGLAGRRRPAVAPRRGPQPRAPAPPETEVGPPRRRHRRARPRHLVPAAARGGAGGAGPADLRRRRPRLLVAGAGPRRPRLAARAREPARRGSAAHRPVVAVPRGGYGRARCRPGSRPRGREAAAACGPRSRPVTCAIGRLLRRRARARRARAARGAAGARDRRHGLRPRHARAPRRRPPAREPAQADAARGRVRARRGPRPARLPRRRAGPRPRRGARGRGRARVRGPGRHPPDDDPPREGPRVPGRRGRRPRPPVRRPESRRCSSARTTPPACGSPRSAAATRSPPPPGSASRPQDAEADAEEERRLFYVAMTRARRAADPVRRHRHERSGRTAQRRPADRLDRARDHAHPAAPELLERTWDGRIARVVTKVITPETLPGRGARQSAPATQHHRSRPRCPACPRRSRRTSSAAGRRRSGSPTASSPTTRSAATASTSSACSTCRTSPPPLPEDSSESRSAASTRGSAARSSTPRWRTWTSTTRARPATRRCARSPDTELTDEEVAEIQALVEAFARSPLCHRLTQATRITREAGFHFALDPDGSGPLVRGFVDVLANEADGAHLVDRLQDRPRVRGGHARGLRRAPLRDAAARLRARGAPGGRATRRGRLLPARAPGRAAHVDLHRRGRAGHRRAHPEPRPRHPHRTTIPVTDTPHRELCGTCPGRTQLCSYSQEETLRPPPALWLGARARRTPPAGTPPVAAPPPR